MKLKSLKNKLLLMKHEICKVLRYAKIYGITRSLVKVVGRTNIKVVLPNFKSKRTISLIGCGQFAFSTIAFFLYFSKKGHFLGCYDIDNVKANKLKNFYGFKKNYIDSNALFFDKSCKLIYIASNHASHTPYAIKALQNNIDVYVEKPLSTTIEQFKSLIQATRTSKSKIYVGYNRPFSKAVVNLGEIIENLNSPISLSCFISGHYIEKNHWYRNPDEGTRVCGNLGHWIDLGMHLLNKTGSISNLFEITITYANKEEIDDNICVLLTTERNDIISIFMTSRSEPFEGINETINFQCANIIAKIDDFRKMKIWQNERVKSETYWPKDVGHKYSIHQPFTSLKRDFNEIKTSTLLMLFVKDMVLNNEKYRFVDLKKEFFDLCN